MKEQGLILLHRSPVHIVGCSLLRLGGKAGEEGFLEEVGFGCAPGEMLWG